MKQIRNEPTSSANYPETHDEERRTHRRILTNVGCKKFQLKIAGYYYLFRSMLATRAAAQTFLSPNSATGWGVATLYLWWTCNAGPSHTY
jgi:hypothetical protein